jgi:DNA replication and repair protein RecF
MAELRKIVVQDFRNIELQELEFSSNVNCISGNNGEGKTNLLDAVWYLSMTKSSRGVQDRFNWRHGTGGFAIAGTYGLPDGLTTRVSVKVESGPQQSVTKQIRRDDKPCERLSDHIGEFPVVMVSPGDGALVSESADERRRFVNSVLSQMERMYLSDVQKYNRILDQRNAALKDHGSSAEGLLDALDPMLEEYGRRIFERRSAFMKELEPRIRDFYSRISGVKETVSVEYRSDLAKGSLEDILREGRGRDVMLKYTFSGIQRDDFLFQMDGYPIRKCGSQGQQKSFLVALKFAQYEIMRQEGGPRTPILLLDDLFDKLDLDRISNLLRMVSGNGFGQIFITDADPGRLRRTVDSITSDRAYFEAEGGVFKTVL